MYNRSFGLHIAGSCVIGLLCTLCGMVIYANYVDCDPLSDNKLTDPDGGKYLPNGNNYQIYKVVFKSGVK